MLQATILPAPEDLLASTLEFLRSPPRLQYGAHDCDLYLSNVAHTWCLHQEGGRSGGDGGHREGQIVAVAMEAAWELVRRGILRPGGRSYPDTSASDPGRFCLTARGREWLATADETHFIVMQPGSLSRALAAFEKRFGEAFEQRAQEALKSRLTDGWLSTCAMCGAAAESILLALAIAKTGDQEAVIKEYRTATGRKKTIDGLVGQQSAGIQGQFRSLMGLLSYWRDDAAHGLASPISGAEADQALRQLLVLAQFADRHWTELTA